MSRYVTVLRSRLVKRERRACDGRSWVVRCLICRDSWNSKDPEHHDRKCPLCDAEEER